MMDKIEAIKAALTARLRITKMLLEKNKDKHDFYKYCEYYKGKRDGYQQAIDLLNESYESIAVEL